MCHKFCQLLIIAIFSFCFGNLNAVFEGKLGKFNASASIGLTYDSRVFMLPTNEFNAIKDSNGSSTVPVNEMKSEHDLILNFSPALHFSSKIGLLKISGSAGVNISHFFLNDDKSYIAPTTTLAIDFDDTLALKKRVSSNAKIRFESTFDIGQSIGASVLDQNLVSYTYVSAGFNVRYNHSPKFGLGGGTSYSYRYYQSASNDNNRPNLDFSTLPLSFRAFYIYSEKLDFFSDYTFSKSKAYNTNGLSNLTDAHNHSFSLGADGVYSSKFSGTISVGYSLVDYLSAVEQNQDNLITSVSLNWKHNSKTSSNYSLNRAFSPTAQGFSTFSTTIRAGLSHRFTQSLSGNSYLSISRTEYTYPVDSTQPTASVKEGSSMDAYGFGVGLVKPINNVFSASGGYDFSLMDKGNGSYNRHLIQAQLTGQF